MPVKKSNRKKHKPKAHALKKPELKSASSGESYNLIYVVLAVALIIASLSVLLVKLTYLVKGFTFFILFAFGCYVMMIAKQPEDKSH